MTSIVGDGVRRGFEIGSFEPDHGHTLMLQLKSGLQARIACDDLPGMLGHNWLAPTKPTDGREEQILAAEDYLPQLAFQPKVRAMSLIPTMVVASGNTTPKPTDGREEQISLGK